MWSLPFPRALEKEPHPLLRFFEALPGAKLMGSQEVGGDVIPLLVYQCGQWAARAGLSSRTASLLGAGPRPQDRLLSPGATATGGRCCPEDAPVSGLGGNARVGSPQGLFPLLLSGR